MLTRISLIVALIAGLAVAGLNFFMVKDKLTTVIAERNDWHGKYDTTYAELNQTKDTLARTKADLDKTKSTLNATIQERDAAVAKRDAETKRANELASQLNTTTAQRNEAQANLAAYVNTGYKPPEIVTMGKKINNLQEAIEVSKEENMVMLRKNQQLSYKMAELIGTNAPITLPGTLTGKVLVADPKWDFVVLNLGSDEGLLEHAELLVSRDGKLVAKLRISSVQKDRSIANVMPGWKLGDVMEGDQVIPAYPASS